MDCHERENLPESRQAVPVFHRMLRPLQLFSRTFAYNALGTE